jgi:HK97 family phage prohead protease
MLRKTLSLNDAELKLKGDTATFSGYASSFNGVDSYGDTILPTAYDNVLKSGKMPKMFENHRSWELPIGKWLKMYTDEKGLIVEGEFTPNHARAEMVRASMKHGTLDGLSIGFRMTKDDYELVDDGRQRIIKNISELIEVSPVTFPADDAARVDLTSVKSELEFVTDIKDLENFLREAGGFSKGLAIAVLARAKHVFRGEPQTGLDEKARAELQRLIDMPSLLS